MNWHEWKKDNYGTTDIAKEFGIKWTLLSKKTPPCPEFKHNAIDVFCMTDTGFILRASWNGERFYRVRSDTIGMETVHNVIAWILIDGNMIASNRFRFSEIAEFANIANAFYKKQRS